MRILLLRSILAACATAVSPGSTAGAQSTPSAQRAEVPLQGVEWTEPASRIQFVWISGGCFNMGSDSASSIERPQHKVCVKGFYLARHEVTQAQYHAMLSTNPSAEVGATLPVDSVTWDEAKRFAATLSKRSGHHVRLPSEAEWEFACSAGNAKPTCGSDIPIDSAWFAQNSGKRPRPVGLLKPNDFGLHDMSGNVWEWVEDCYNTNYRGAPVDGTAWQSGDCSMSPLRGGSYMTAPEDLRPTYRQAASRSGRLFHVGFRVAISPR
jgi:formylglycine-generating enzyme required for sulfatase activity